MACDAIVEHQRAEDGHLPLFVRSTNPDTTCIEALDMRNKHLEIMHQETTALDHAVVNLRKRVREGSKLASLAYIFKRRRFIIFQTS